MCAVKLLQFAGDPALTGRISETDGSTHGLVQPGAQCPEDSRVGHGLQEEPIPEDPCDSPVVTVESFRFLGTVIAQDLKWELNINLTPH